MMAPDWSSASSGRTIADALTDELLRRHLSMTDAAKMMQTTVQNVSRWAHPSLMVEPDGEQLDAVMDFLKVDERQMASLLLATKRRRGEIRRAARRSR